MNLFRSEEHARNWSEFKPYYLEMLKPLSYWLERFSSEMMRSRGRQDFKCSIRLFTKSCEASLRPAERRIMLSWLQR